jgi:hypothetical protein
MVSLGYRIRPNHKQVIQFRRAGKILRRFHFQKPLAVAAQTSVTFQTFVTFRTSDLRKLVPLVDEARYATTSSKNFTGGYAMFMERISGPRCQKCGETMALRIIEPERPGFDSRTFECPKCFVTDTLVVSISRDIEVSLAPSLASKATPSPQSSWRLSRFSRP